MALRDEISRKFCISQSLNVEEGSELTLNEDKIGKEPFIAHADQRGFSVTFPENQSQNRKNTMENTREIVVLPILKLIKK
uniref:Uncharacterized protein n=1 Tax=Cucumis melo TaxID=3656 RepID=A0A9I9D903_CUCME